MYNWVTIAVQWKKNCIGAITIKKNFLSTKKINKTKSWFFERVNKNDKPLARLTKGRERTHINKIRNEKGGISMDTAEVQKKKKNKTVR